MLKCDFWGNFMCITDSEALPNNTKTNIVTVKKKKMDLWIRMGHLPEFSLRSAHTKEHVAGRETGT